MGKHRGFLEFNKKTEANQPVSERVTHYREFTKKLSDHELGEQAGRCMDCGIPFCHSGCPLGNLIPDFNDAVYKNQWQKALQILHATNNFPEFTGRLCPAPCESACVLGVIKPPVSIELIEKYIVERGFKEKWIQPQPPIQRTGKQIAIIGSGPAGLAAAQQLNRAGHTVTVFERDKKIGGLLRYGIPDFKLDKSIIDRRLTILEQEGIHFKTNTHVGVNYKSQHLKAFDAIVLCTGATVPRELPVPGADARGIVQAMTFLRTSNEVIEGTKELPAALSAKEKHVIVIGGGDTGSDCIGTSNRQGARSVTNFEIMPMPGTVRSTENPWPYWPFTLKTSTSHEEGCHRNWSIATKEFIKDPSGNLKALKTVQVIWEKVSGKPPVLKEMPGTEKEWPCDLVLLALGFKGPEPDLITELQLQTDTKTRITTTGYQTSVPHVFTAGDARRGQSLIVWAISEGREAACEVDTFLMGSSSLPSKEKGDLPAA
ncbi:glutamate synthase subunit beta [Ascidiimonas aurantiaca]|uniref:glutamate synthase subunit beta n=1 Tax=Ascidiimonas aurantiaca TaxID=1685432 RepID=UPI0030EE90A0